MGSEMCIRDRLELAKEFEEKMLRTTSERCTRASMRTIKTAPFCTSLLERTLDVQARLEESVPQQHGVDCSLRRLLTEAYEASAGLSENESTSVRVTAPAAPCMPSRPIPARLANAGPSQANSGPPRQAFYGPRSSASRLNRRVRRPRVLETEDPPQEARRQDLPRAVALLLLSGRLHRPVPLAARVREEPGAR